MRAFLSRHVFASIAVGVALGFALGWFGADRVHASGGAALASLAALRVLRRRGIPSILPPAPEVQASDAVEDSAATEAAQSAREDAATEARTGWAAERTRKLPPFEGGPLILALVLGAWAALSPSLGSCQETPKNATPGPEAGAAPAEIGPGGCRPLEGPFPSTVAGGPAVGFWVEGGKGYVCPCFTSPSEFGEVSMVPGGCKIPDALPLIAVRPEGWAYLAGGIAKSNVEIRALRDARDSARDQRDVAIQEGRALGEYNGQLIEERDAARKSLLSGIGAGALAGGCIVALIAFLATN